MVFKFMNLFTMPEQGGALNDTVAAVTHILFTVTSAVHYTIAIEPQLWVIYIYIYIYIYNTILSFDLFIFHFTIYFNFIH